MSHDRRLRLKKECHEGGERLVEFRNLSEHTGAEVIGVDLAQPQTPATIAEILRVFAERCVIVFRDQKLTQAELVAATALFGAPADYDLPTEHRTEEELKQLPQIMMITNIRKDGKPIGALPDGEMWFHHDMIHSQHPHKATLLYALEIPSWGGETVFSNLFVAYDELPQDVKQKLDGRMALNAFNYGAQFRGDPQAASTRRQAIHPAIRTHEETGRKAIYMDRLMTHSILGLASEESDRLLDFIFDHIEQEKFTYEHQWRKGDLVMWDNRSSIHARKDFPADEVRLMWRTTIKGEQAAH